MDIKNKKTKIVATIGPSTESEEQLARLLKVGMNIIRMNFSHGDFAEHQLKVDRARKVSEELGIPVAFMQDLAGPEIRTGDIVGDPIKISKGAKVLITTNKADTTDKVIYITYKQLPKEVKVGGTILIDDGKINLNIKKIDIKKGEIECIVKAGGVLKSKRGVNVPGANLSLKSLTLKDKSDLDFAIKNKLDYVAFSFVRTADDVRELRKILDSKGCKEMGIIPKIETQQAVDNIDEIIELSDAVMIARGDLAPEMTLEDVPIVQKMIIEKCNAAGKPVITATQMIETMMEKPVPTRAEVSDIANAIFDGTDAIMLSGETALGDYPIEAVEVMSRIALKVEQQITNEGFDVEYVYEDVMSTGRAVTLGAVVTADEVGATVISPLTERGYSARMISRFKPAQTIIAFTPNENTYRKMLISWGVTPVLIKRFKTFRDAQKEIRDYLIKNKLVKKGDKAVIVSGAPFGKVIESNMMLIESF